MGIIERARELRPIIERAAKSLSEEQAIEAVELFGRWRDGVEYAKDERVAYEGILYRVLQGHTSQADWTPDAAPSLFAKVLIPNQDTVPVWEQPDSTNPYMKGDRVHYPTADDPIYTSTIDNNVWSPDSYPQGWTEEGQ